VSWRAPRGALAKSQNFISAAGHCPREGAPLAAEGVRWSTVRDFLDDLPVRHCTVKPPHEYCTICMRINYGVAHDCPLYAKRYEEPTPAAPRAPASKVPPKPPMHPHDAVTDRVTVDVVEHVLAGEDFPVIEFAGPRRAKKGPTAPTKARPKEEPLEVVPIDVEPMKEPPVARDMDEGPSEEEGEGEAAAQGATVPEDGEADPEALAPEEATAEVARPKVDPEELMHRIMEELDIPEEDEDEPAEAPAPAVKRETRPSK
jgi:hypothetical protein